MGLEEAFNRLVQACVGQLLGIPCIEYVICMRAAYGLWRMTSDSAVTKLGLYMAIARACFDENCALPVHLQIAGVQLQLGK